MSISESSDECVSAGDFARDREQLADGAENELVIVLEVTDQSIDESVIYEEPDGTEQTVYDWNDGNYDAKENAVIVVYQETIADRFASGWINRDVLEAYESGELSADRGTGGYGIKTYTMPESRLVPISAE